MKYERCSWCGMNVLESELIKHQKTHDKAREFIRSGSLPKGWGRAA